MTFFSSSLVTKWWQQIWQLGQTFQEHFKGYFVIQEFGARIPVDLTISGRRKMDWSHSGRMLWNVTVKSKAHTLFRHPIWKFSYIIKKPRFLSFSCLSIESVDFGCDSNSCLVFQLLLQLKKRGQKNSELLFIVSGPWKTEKSFNIVL